MGMRSGNAVRDSPAPFLILKHGFVLQLPTLEFGHKV